MTETTYKCDGCDFKQNIVVPVGSTQPKVLVPFISGYEFCYDCTEKAWKYLTTGKPVPCREDCLFCGRIHPPAPKPKKPLPVNDGTVVHMKCVRCLEPGAFRHNCDQPVNGFGISPKK